MTGEVVALVWGGIGNGPLNVVLDGRPDAALPAGARFAVGERLLTVGDAMFDLAHAEPWAARPDWDALRARRAQIVATAHIARRSIAGLSERSLLKQAGPAVEAAVVAFQQAWQQVASADLPSTIRNLQSAIRNLCGLGPGLTPAGDDWLAGWLLAQHLAPNLTGLNDLSDLVTDAATHRTTTLSRAFLSCAAAGGGGSGLAHASLRTCGGTNDQIYQFTTLPTPSFPTARPPAQRCSPDSSRGSRCLTRLLLLSPDP